VEAECASCMIGDNDFKGTPKKAALAGGLFI
jgi:hypothetical protein